MNEIDMNAYDKKEDLNNFIIDKIVLYELIDGILYVTENGNTIRIRRRRFK